VAEAGRVGNRLAAATQAGRQCVNGSVARGDAGQLACPLRPPLRSSAHGVAARVADRYDGRMRTDDPPLFVLLNEIAIIEQLARHRFEAAQPDGLLISHFSLLNHLVRVGDGRSPVRIAAAFQLAKSAITNTLQRLEARGFVRLEPDPSDGRGKLVFLTPAGRARRDDAVATSAATFATVRNLPGTVAQVALIDQLAVLRQALDEARDAG